MRQADAGRTAQGGGLGPPGVATYRRPGRACIVWRRSERKVKTVADKVKRNGSGERTSYANVVEVCCTPAEVVLLFGVRHARQAGQKEPKGTIRNCIILSPVSAKRFTVLLNDFIRDYESRYGPPELERPPVSASARWTSGTPPPVWENAGENVRRLTELIQNLNAPYGFERSFKMLQGALLRKRFLLTMSKDSFGSDPQERILNICQQLNMPEEFHEAFAEKLPDAGYVHFGFEEGESSSLYKAYLEFWTDWEQEIFNKPKRSDPFLVYLGFKWDISDNTRRALARYVCHPHLCVDDMVERLSSVYGSPERAGAVDIAKAILDIASSRAADEKILYMEVTEEDNPRVSFDINVYKAEVPLRELFPALSEMSRHYSIPSEEFHDVYDGIETKLLGHIAGGIDREGRDFFTVYYGMEGH